MMKRKEVIIVAILLSFFFGCKFINRGKEEEKGRILFVLIDLTGSTDDIRADFASSIEKIFKDLKADDKLLIFGITAKSEFQFRPIFELELPSSTDAPNKFLEMRLKRRIEAVKKDTMKYFLKIFAELSKIRGAERSDIFGALKLAATYFENEKRAKILIIFSDMLQETEDYNFKISVPDKEEVAKVIFSEKKLGNFPDLSDVKVYIVGLRHDDAKKTAKLRLFWKIYLNEAGAKEVEFDNLLTSLSK